jgi:hypothetical protein
MLDKELAAKNRVQVRTQDGEEDQFRAHSEIR